MSEGAAAIPGQGSTGESVPDVELNTGVVPSSEGQPIGDEGGSPTEAIDGQQPKAGEEGLDGQRDDGRVIPKWMKELQTANPEAYKKAKTDLFELRDRRSVHPTPQAAREEHDLVQSLGGTDGVATLREDAGIFKTAAQQFLKGDPAFVKDLWDEDPIAAALHVAPMLETYKTRDLDGYRSTVARLWDLELQGVGFGPALKDVMEAVKRGDKDGALGLLDSFNKWYESIGQVARKAEDPRVKTLLAERARQHDDAAKADNDKFLTDYRTETTNMVVDEGAKVFDSFFKGRKISAEDRGDLLREAFAIANRAVLTDKTFVEQRDKHLANGDSHSAQQLTKSRYSREMPEAVKRVARRYGLVSGTPGQSQQKQNPQQPNAPKVEQGWTAVNQRPEPETIDRSKTTNDMILAGKAILLGGKKVDWSALKKQGK